MARRFRGLAAAHPGRSATRAAAGVAAVIAVAAMAGGCGDPRPPNPVTAGPAGGPDGPGWPTLRWQATELPLEAGVLARRFVAAASSGAGVVAIGYEDRGEIRDGIVWHAADGATFAPVADPALFGAVELVDVAAVDGTFVALGTAPADPPGGVESRIAAFVSADGRSWSRVADDPAFEAAYATSLGAGPGGFVAAGFEAAGGGILLRSADGVAWSRVPLADLGLSGATWQSVAGGPAGWLAAGRWDARGVAFASPDGGGWTGAALPALRRADGYRADAITAVPGEAASIVRGSEVSPCGILGLGEACAAETAAWWSDGSGDWAPINMDASPIGLPGVGLASAGERGFVAVGGDGAWWSPDGIGWDALDAPDRADVAVNDVVVAGDRIVAAGEVFDSQGRSIGWLAAGGPELAATE